MSTNLTKHSFTVSREKREQICGHKGKVLWFTGLSGSGKSTLANALDEKLNSKTTIHIFWMVIMLEWV